MAKVRHNKKYRFMSDKCAGLYAVKLEVKLTFWLS